MHQSQEKKDTFVQYQPDELEVDENKGARKDIHIIKMSMASIEFQQYIPIRHRKRKQINQNQYIGVNTIRLKEKIK